MAVLVQAKPPQELDTPSKAVLASFYDNKIVRNFGIAAIFWGIAGMLVGVIAAFQLARPELNMGTPYTTFGRCTPTR